MPVRVSEDNEANIFEVIFQFTQAANVADCRYFIKGLFDFDHFCDIQDLIGINLVF